jgi:ABC-2 type transport system ATP-binding protein
MIETRSLTKRYKDKTAVDSLNLKIEKGEVFALLGTNGAGKTTTVKMLSFLTKASGGDIIINGKNTRECENDIKKILNLSPQETAIAPNLTVLENLDFMAGVYAISNKKERIASLIEVFNLTSVLKQKAKTLSGGWQRKLSIALALINDPEILFLDEPTLGLDVISRRELWKVIDSLKGKKTIILTTHYMEEAEKLSDRIGIMSEGKLRCIGTAEELKKMAQTDSFEDAFVKLATGGEL